MQPHSYDDMPALDSLVGDPLAETTQTRHASSLQTIVDRLRLAMATHPAPGWAWAETAVWLVVIATIFDHFAEGTTATITWWLTIGPHEIGHYICAPFGTLIMFMGGTIWQVLFWLLVGFGDWIFRKRRRVLLLCLVVVGHSLIDAARYIGDAQARSLPLLFGMSSDHHDWWNILSMTGLLPYDGLFAALTRLTGALIIFGAALAGVYWAWVRRGKG